MTLTIRIIIVGILLLLIDWYFYQAVSTVFRGASLARKNIAFYIYWGFTVVSFIVLLTPIFFPLSNWPQYLRVYLIAFMVMVIISKLIGSLFLLMDDIIRLFRWLAGLIAKPVVTNSVAQTTNGNKISRLMFLNYVALGMAALPFSSLIYGMIKGAYDYKVRKLKVVLPNLPASFNGLKILQISDIHSGSFYSTNHVADAIEIILKQKADIIFFTGDLVNNRATETEPFIELFSRIKAPMGVYSILGNHDYGDYVEWESAEAKAKNLNDLKHIHAKIGWKLLMNEHVALRKGEEEIALIGIENWGGKLNFPKYGNMKKAYTGTEK